MKDTCLLLHLFCYVESFRVGYTRAFLELRIKKVHDIWLKRCLFEEYILCCYI